MYKTPEEIEKIGLERITCPSASKTFMETIQIAKWMRENMPKIRLNQINFAKADNIIATKKLAQNRKVLAKYENDLPNFIAKVRELLE